MKLTFLCWGQKGEEGEEGVLGMYANMCVDRAHGSPTESGYGDGVFSQF